MASVTVFVDDAVRGTLPGVCARDGGPTSSSLQRREGVGNRAGLGVAWLLLLAGPLGWLGLLVIALSKNARVEELSVEVPMCDAAYHRMRGARSLRDRSVLALIGGTIVGMLLLVGGQDTTLMRFAALGAAAAVAVSFVAMIVGSVRFDRESVGVTLDASRRWVTLTNVHPSFATACDAQTAERRHERA